MHRKPILIAAALLLASTASFAQPQAKPKASQPKPNASVVEVGPLKSEVYSPTQTNAEEQARKKWVPANMTGYVKGHPPGTYALSESPTLPCAPDYCPRSVVRVRADRN
jgi:hypothetical protein